MIYNDYSKSKNIAHDWIHWPCLRVSSREVPSYTPYNPFGKWYETWIFSNCPLIQTHQKFFKTKQATLKAHNHIVRNLRENLRRASHG